MYCPFFKCCHTNVILQSQTKHFGQCSFQNNILNTTFRHTSLNLRDHIGYMVVGCPPRLREVVVPIPSRVILNSLKMVVSAVLHGAQGCRVTITTDWLALGQMNEKYW